MLKKMTGLSTSPLIFSGPARLDEVNKIYFICFISLHLAEITGLKKLTFFELFFNILKFPKLFLELDGAFGFLLGQLRIKQYYRF